MECDTAIRAVVANRRIGVLRNLTGIFDSELYRRQRATCNARKRGVDDLDRLSDRHVPACGTAGKLTERPPRRSATDNKIRWRERTRCSDDCCGLRRWDRDDIRSEARRRDWSLIEHLSLAWSGLRSRRIGTVDNHVAGGEDRLTGRITNGVRVRARLASGNCSYCAAVSSRRGRPIRDSLKDHHVALPLWSRVRKLEQDVATAGAAGVHDLHLRRRHRRRIAIAIHDHDAVRHDDTIALHHDLVATVRTTRNRLTPPVKTRHGSLPRRQALKLDPIGSGAWLGVHDVRIDAAVAGQTRGRVHDFRAEHMFWSLRSCNRYRRQGQRHRRHQQRTNQDDETSHATLPRVVVFDPRTNRRSTSSCSHGSPAGTLS